MTRVHPQADSPFILLHNCYHVRYKHVRDNFYRKITPLTLVRILLFHSKKPVCISICVEKITQKWKKKFALQSNLHPKKTQRKKCYTLSC